MTSSDIECITPAVRAELPTPWEAWPGGWKGEVEIALIDVVLSIRARYGGPDSGVRGALNRYRATRGPKKTLDDLTTLAAFTPSELRSILGNSQHTGGWTKAEAIVEVARRLSDTTALGSDALIHANDLRPESLERQKAVYTSVRGLGKVTWSYFTMLLGVPDVKADTWVTRWASSATGRNKSPAEARALILKAAGDLKVNPIDLEHAIWAHARSRR